MRANALWRWIVLFALLGTTILFTILHIASDIQGVDEHIGASPQQGSDVLETPLATSPKNKTPGVYINKLHTADVLVLRLHPHGL